MNVADHGLSSIAHVTGKRDVLPAGQPETLIAYITQLVEANPDGRFVEVLPNGDERSETYGALFQEARRLARHIAHVTPGRDQYVALCCESVLNYVPAAWACFMNGFSILPLSVSGLFRNRDAMIQKMERLTQNAGACLILTETQFKPTFDQVKSAHDVEVLDITRLPDVDADHSTSFPPDAPSEIFIETSGTTGLPKLARLGASEIMMRFFSGFGGADAVGLALLGQGTIGGVRLLLPLGAKSIFMDPGRMMSDPKTWLDLVARFGVQQVGMGNSMAAKLNEWFADNAPQHDLSSLKGLYFGSEMIVPDNIKSLIQNLKTCGMNEARASLVYSMTETGPLFVTSMDADDLCDTCKIQNGYFTLQSCFVSWSVRIANEDNETLRMGEIGSIQAKSRTRMFKGYCHRDDSFLEDGWFDTGDLGALTEDGLVLTGRKKSVIIINARKISTEAIEIELTGIEGIKPGHVAALPYRDADSQTDELAVFFAPLDTDPAALDALYTRIRATVSKSFGAKIDHLVSIRDDQFTRTPSGKIKRDALSDALRSGAVQSVERSAAQAEKEGQCGSWIEAKWQQILRLPAAPRRDSNFFDDGGDSLACLQLLMAVEDHFQCRIALEDFYQSPTVDNLSRLTALAVPDADVVGPDGSGVETVEAVMRQMEALFEPWVGPRIGPERLIIGRNLHGSKPPLFWVFQADREFAALADHLGEDQPLYGMRSLVGLFKAQEYRPLIVYELVQRLLTDLQAIHPSGPLILGGNCQGAIIALYLARELRRSGREPDLLVLMEWMFSQGRYDQPTLFLYGETSHTRDTFENNARIGPDWRRDFPDAQVDKIAGGHGDFFDPGKIDVLSAQLKKYLAKATRAGAPSQG